VVCDPQWCNVSILRDSRVQLMSSIMEGFDLVLLSSLFAQPQFQQKYGIQLADGSYTIESRWQIGLNLAVQAGSIIGLLGNGWASERFGYRKTILGAVSDRYLGKNFADFSACHDDRSHLYPLLCPKHSDPLRWSTSRRYSMGNFPDSHYSGKRFDRVSRNMLTASTHQKSYR
jgi:hypothetical protein